MLYGRSLKGSLYLLHVWKLCVGCIMLADCYYILTKTAFRSVTFKIQFLKSCANFWDCIWYFTTSLPNSIGRILMLIGVDYQMINWNAKWSFFRFYLNIKIQTSGLSWLNGLFHKPSGLSSKHNQIIYLFWRNKKKAYYTMIK